MNSSHNDNDSQLDPLHSLNSLQPPAGMQERITERIRQRQLQPLPRGLRRYMWELWLGASIATVAAAAIFCIIVLQARRTASPTVAANIPPHTILPTPAPANVQPQIRGPHPVVQISRARRVETAVPIPHTPPPLPLTAQESLLLALASKPLLAAGAATSQPVTDHGLGANSIFDLEHEQLTPLQPEPLESTPLPPLSSDSTTSGETK